MHTELAEWQGWYRYYHQVGSCDSISTTPPTPTGRHIRSGHATENRTASAKRSNAWTLCDVGGGAVKREASSTFQPHRRRGQEARHEFRLMHPWY